MTARRTKDLGVVQCLRAWNQVLLERLLIAMTDGRAGGRDRYIIER